jgi:DNA-binding NtrC family response regulator
VEKAATIFTLVAAGAREIVPEDDGIADWRRGASAYSLIGPSDGISRIRETLPTFANSSEPVLIESEHGNGRHLIATMIHRLGLRTEGPLIFENLSLLPETLHEKELFGPKGNGSGGLVGHAGGGTLFLDGIEHLSSSAQRRLHSHLAGNEGGGGEGPSARIVASTDRNLSELVRRGRFRSDLQRRLSKLTLFIPPLRDRKEDIPLLTAHFLDRLPVGSGSNGSGTVQAKKETVQSLQEYSWPGNVRELEKELEQAAAYGHSTIRLRDFSAPIRHAARPPKATMKSIREAVGILETEMISQTLSDTNWNKSQAARILGLSRLGLQKKIDRYGLDRRR